MVLVRVYIMAFGRLGDHWAILLAILAVGSMTVGNVTAILQDNIKRMLAYSSIAHAGYVLMGLVAAGLGTDRATREWGVQAVILYLFIYTFMNLGAFSLVVMLRRSGVVGDRVEDFAGLSRRAPGAAFAMLVFMLSLAGIPATAGFIGKWYLFGAAVQAHLTWLAVVAVLNSAVSVYYYPRVVIACTCASRSPMSRTPRRRRWSRRWRSRRSPSWASASGRKAFSSSRASPTPCCSPRAGRFCSQAPRMPDKDDEQTGILRRAGPYLSLGATFAASIALLAWLGRWLDGKLGSAPWLALAGALLGMAVGFYNFFATVLRNPPSD